MKNLTVTIAILFVTALLVLSILLNVKQYYKQEATSDRIENLAESVGKNKVTDTYVKDSVTHTIFSEKVISNNLAEKELALGKTYADSLQKALKISISKIDQATKINAALEAKLFLKESEPIAGKRVLSHKDKTVNLRYYPETDSVDLGVDFGLNEVRYNKKKWIFGKQERFVEMFPDDERIKIKGLKSFTVKESSPKRFGIGFSTGYAITASDGIVKLAPYVGLGANWNLAEF